MEKLNLPEETIINLYHNKNLTQEQIAGIYNCSPATIKKKIEGYYKGKKRVYKKSGKDRMILPIGEIYKKNKSGISKAQLAKEYNCSVTTIKNRIKEYEISKKGGRKAIILPMYHIVKKYELGESIANLAEQYHVSYDTLLRRLDEYYESKGKSRPRQTEISRRRSEFSKSLKVEQDENRIVKNIINNDSSNKVVKSTELEK